MTVCGVLFTDGGCSLTSLRDSWGGMVGDTTGIAGTCSSSTTTVPILQPGESCWIKLVGHPEVKGKITGYLVVRQLDVSGAERFVAVVPVTIIGVR
jgi:hypothetical protein